MSESISNVWMAYADGTKRQMPQTEVDALVACINENLSHFPVKSFSCDWMSGFCPVQAEGKVNDKPWYFRARWRGWRFEVDGEVVLRGQYGQDNSASWMPLHDAIRLIGAGVAAYGARLDEASKEKP